MEDTWIGPYKVSKVSETGSCNLVCVKTGREIKQKVNVSQLKKYVPSESLCVGEMAKTEEKKWHVEVLQEQLYDDSLLRLW